MYLLAEVLVCYSDPFFDCCLKISLERSVSDNICQQVDTGVHSSCLSIMTITHRIVILSWHSLGGVGYNRLCRAENKVLTCSLYKLLTSKQSAYLSSIFLLVFLMPNILSSSLSAGAVSGGNWSNHSLQTVCIMVSSCLAT